MLTVILNCNCEWTLLFSCYIYIIQMVSYLVCKYMCVCAWQDDMTIWHDTMTWQCCTVVSRLPDQEGGLSIYVKYLKHLAKCNKKRKNIWWNRWNEGGAGLFIIRFANRRVPSRIGWSTILLYLQYFLWH